MHTLHFRRLGFKSRREGLIIGTKPELQRVIRALLNERRNSSELLASDIERESMHQHMTARYPGVASDTEGSSINYALKPSKWSRHRMKAVAVRWHEELHLLFGQVAGRYGEYARRRLIANLVLSLPSGYRKELNQFLSFLNKSYSAIRNPMRDTHEEVITNLFHYLNTQHDRCRVRDYFDMTREESRAFHKRMRDMGRYLQAAAEVATPNWLFVYRPWALRATIEPGVQLTFRTGPGNRIGPWAGKMHW